MSIELCVLASGSAGNCTVVRTPAGVLLVDVGIGPRTAAQRMAGTGVCLADVRAICLTHLDRDHFNRNWLGTILSREIRVFCHFRRVDELVRLATLGADSSPEDAERLRALVTPFQHESFEPLDGLAVNPVLLVHDRLGSHGFVFDGFGCRIGYASDLGRIPETFEEDFEDLDLLAIESNYDRQMQLDSPRPWFLKRRIMGGWGHLSNEQALEAVRKVLRRSETRGLKLPSRIVLLHRSRECNCPELVRRLFTRDARIAPRLVLAEQFERSEWLRANGQAADTGMQLSLAFG
ncbi:MAG TPA: MBL fold metallo-hydrolase [Tepidisphaeraceae bacterium]|nr:MBL fold metallo-hydrolase [Tepidisphaeraceae bacterium]